MSGELSVNNFEDQLKTRNCYATSAVPGFLIIDWGMPKEQAMKKLALALKIREQMRGKE